MSKNFEVKSVEFATEFINKLYSEMGDNIINIILNDETGDEITLEEFMALKHDIETGSLQMLIDVDNSYPKDYIYEICFYDPEDNNLNSYFMSVSEWNMETNTEAY